MTPDRLIDLSGLNCPLPILRAKKALADMASGTVLEVIATDAGAPKDFEAFCRQTGNACWNPPPRRKASSAWCCVASKPDRNRYCLPRLRPDIEPKRMTTLTLIRPDDWHLHLRDGAALAAVLPDTARQMGRAIIMPNLKPPVTTVEAAAAYRERILAALPAGSRFEPLMTLYLTDNTSAEEVRKARASGFVHGIKLYPAGATTNSDFGVSSIDKAMPALEAMADCGMPLLVHGEVTDSAIDIFDREAVFIEQVFQPLLARLPSLRVVFEHITTKDAAEYVASAPDNIAATITAHHLLMNRNAIFVGGIRPHHYCCRYSSANCTARRWSPPPPPVRPSSSSAPTARRMHAMPRKPPAAVPACTPPMPPSSCMPKPSRRPVRWTSWKPLPA
jgi:TusA-related sulfurtransferase/predicted TIM-barrel fold metal-dependent hydrolase